MIKAGNKNINADGSAAANAAGIVAKLTEENVTVSTCYNSGHIEALGSLAGALKSPTVTNGIITDNNQAYKINFEFNSADIINVKAGSITVDGNDNSSSYVFRNGLHGKYTNEIGAGSLENEHANETGLDINGLNIKASDQTAHVASIDEMGVPKSFFVT